MMLYYSEQYRYIIRNSFILQIFRSFQYPPVTIDDVYKEVLEQAENFKKYAG